MTTTLLYDKLRTAIVDAIGTGTYKADDRIPSERELEDLYGLSRTTVRKAIDTLINDGVLYHKHGKGTFVAPQKFARSLQQVTGFTEAMLAAGKRLETILRDICIVAPTSRVAEELNLQEPSKVQRIERVRLVDDEPIAIQIAFLPFSRGIQVNAQDLAANGYSLYATLRAKFGVIASSASETIEAVSADEAQSEFLHVPPQSPLLFVERTVQSQFQAPMEYSQSYYRGDRYKYQVRLPK